MITFGTLRQGPQDTVEALACLVAMQDEMAAWNRERSLAGQPSMKLSIGAHCGPAVRGDVGSRRHLVAHAWKRRPARWPARA